MQIRIEHITSGTEEIVIRCYETHEEIKSLIKQLKPSPPKVQGTYEGRVHLVKLSQILYFESVDHAVYAYTKQAVYRLVESLTELEPQYSPYSFFRCSKSMIINLNEIRSLKSMMGSRMDAVLSNGEHIVITRHYVKALREELSRNG